MDPVTHGIIGATTSQFAADKEKLRPAALVGFSAALLADVDIFIHSANDPLLNVEIHRQFTHSVFFIPFGALVAALLLWFLMRRYLSYKEIYLYSLLGYATSGLADSLTSYGTQLFWPLVDERFAFNIISVFDPLFTLGLLVPFAFALYKKEKRFFLFGVMWMVAYLSFGLVQQNRAQNAAEELIEQRNHNAQQTVVKPTLCNQVLWGLRYMTADSVYAAGIRIGIFSGQQVYVGESAPLLKWKDNYENYKGTFLYEDIGRFSKLSNGFLIQHPSQKNIIGDARYSMLPTSMQPLWGIQADTTRPDEHVPFLNFRDANNEVRQKLIKMLSGD